MNSVGTTRKFFYLESARNLAGGKVRELPVAVKVQIVKIRLLEIGGKRAGLDERDVTLVDTSVWIELLAGNRRPPQARNTKRAGSVPLPARFLLRVVTAAA